MVIIKVVTERSGYDKVEEPTRKDISADYSEVMLKFIQGQIRWQGERCHSRIQPRLFSLKIYKRRVNQTLVSLEPDWQPAIQLPIVEKMKLISSLIDRILRENVFYEHTKILQHARVAKIHESGQLK